MNARSAQPGQADSARSHTLRLGAKLGVSLATFGGASANGDVFMSVYRTRAAFAGFAQLRLRKSLYAQPELGIYGKGATYQSDGMKIGGSRSNYLELAALLRAEIPVGPKLASYVTPYLLAGPSLGLLLKAEIVNRDGSSSESTSTETIDISAIGGLGATMPLGPGSLLLEGRYHVGFLGLNKSGNPDIKNRLWSFLLGYQYALR